MNFYLSIHFFLVDVLCYGLEMKEVLEGNVCSDITLILSFNLGLQFGYKSPILSLVSGLVVRLDRLMRPSKGVRGIHCFQYLSYP